VEYAIKQGKTIINLAPLQIESNPVKA